MRAPDLIVDAVGYTLNLMFWSSIGQAVVESLYRLMFLGARGSRDIGMVLMYAALATAIGFLARWLSRGVTSRKRLTMTLTALFVLSFGLLFLASFLAYQSQQSTSLPLQFIGALLVFGFAIICAGSLFWTAFRRPHNEGSYRDS